MILCLVGFNSHLQGQSRFSLLTPKESGVDFSNDVKDVPEHNILIYSNYYGGAGVGIGDFNNDGLQDLFFAGNLVADKMYINQGNLSFKDISQSAGITHNDGWSSGVVIADVNQDGWLDVYVTRELYDDKPEWRKNLLYINQGDLTFKEEAEAYGIADTSRTRHATFLDYDRDGDLDLFLLNQPPNPGNYSPYLGTNLAKEEFRPRLYRKDGNRYTDVSQEAGILHPGFGNSVSACDMNQDGWVDIYLANDFYEPDRLYINQQDGTFLNVIDNAMPHISFYSMGVDAADINNDGLLDISVVDMVAEDNYRSKANMSGMNPKAFWNVVQNGGHYQYMYNALFLNQGNNHFSDIAQLSGVSNTDWSWSNLLADFDNDGWKDLYVTNGLLRDIRNKDSEKKVSKYILGVINDYILNNPDDGNVVIWDILDLDKVMSLIPSEKLPNYVFKNMGALTFEKQNEEWGLDQSAFSNGAAYGDLDNDGDLDIVVSNINEPAFIYQNHTDKEKDANFLRIELENASIKFGTKALIKYGGQRQFQEITNVRGIYSTSESHFHFGLGNIKTIDSLIITWPNGKQTIKTQVAANQILEVSETSSQMVRYSPEENLLFKETTEQSGFSYLHRENKFDDFEREVLLPHKMSQLGPGLASADVNQDGREDFYIGAAIGSIGKLFLQQADGTFLPSASEPWRVHKGFEDVAATFFDANGDSHPDLYVVSGGNEYAIESGAYQDRLYLNQGDGTFRNYSSVLPIGMSSGSCVVSGDYDADGDVDLFVGGRQVPGQYSVAPRSYLLRNETPEGGVPTFVDITSEMAPALMNPGMVTDATWADIDGDKDLDLLVVGEWMPIQIYENLEGKLAPMKVEIEHSTIPDLAQTVGWWSAIRASDLDGDGDQDFVLGNLGLNYKYKASYENPFCLYYNDFDNNGSKDIVLGYYDDESLYPLRGRECSSQQVPSIKENFPSYHTFATATLSDVYGMDLLNQSSSFQATQFASCWLKNLGNNKFLLEELPIEAQFSSVNDILIEDFDGDEIEDLVLAGNMYASEVETPRNDASMGLFLKGLGNGNFKPISPVESGLYLPYDVKDLEIIRTANGTKILAGCNQNFLRVIDISSQQP